MRLDRFLSECGIFTRSESKQAIRAGRVQIDGCRVSAGDDKVEPEKQTVTVDGREIVYRKYRYIMMNKPEGVVSATEDGDRTVLDLLPDEYRRFSLFPCGRLDKNTVGLILLTNDGPLSHLLLSPKHHVEKEYRFSCKFPLSDDDLRTLEAGVDIGGYRTAPCRVTRTGEREGVIILHEGKYHQIKLMAEAVHNQIVFLERISFGGIPLDPALPRGGWRELGAAEIAVLHSHK